MNAHATKPLMRRLLAVAGAALIALAAASPARAAKVFSPGANVGAEDQFSYVGDVAVRTDGQVLVADGYAKEVRRFGTDNTLQNVAVISDTLGGAALSCLATAGDTDFIVNSPWDRPIRKYNQSGSETASVDGYAMYSGSGFNGKPGPGNVSCVASSGNDLFATSDRGSSGSIISLSRWSVSDLSLGPDTDGPPFAAYPTGLAADPDSNAYVVDPGRQELISYDRNLQHRWSAGGPGTTPGKLHAPTKVAVAGGLAYVIDNGIEGRSDSRLTVFDLQTGAYVRTIAMPFTTTAITFDPTNSYEPIISDGNSVYRGVFATRPVVRIAGKPPKATHSRAARFRFSSDEPSTSYTCRLDRGRSKPCQASSRFRGLSVGRHTLKVAGAVAGGLTSRIATYSWTVR